MTTTMSSNEAKRAWDAMIKVASNGDEVIIESHGKPTAVVISPEAFQELQQTRHKQRRAEALKRFDELQRRLADRNKDLTGEEIEELANRASREAIDELAAEGKLVFERDQT